MSSNPTSGTAPLTVTFPITVSDSDGNIASWSLDVNTDGVAEYSGSGNPPSTKTYTYSNAGTYTAKLTVTDDDGATATDTATITVSQPTNQPVNQPPRVEITYPKNDEIVNGTIVVEGKASDEDGNETLQKVEIKIDNGEWNEANGTASWNYSLNTKELKNGEHTIYARSYDGHDYSEIASVTITVENGKKGTPGFEMILLLLAFIAMILMRRRRI